MTATRQQVDQAAADAASPTEAQAEAGNYKMGHIQIHGLNVTIENAKGTHRRPEWPALNCHYGYVKGTKGRDGDHVDVFIGPHPESEIVYVIDQESPSGRFDEHKVMMGFTHKHAAKEAYLSNYTKGWHCGPITPMTISQFCGWLDDGDTKNRVAPQVSRYEAEWRTVGGGAPAMIDTDTGEILAGCPGLEGEDLDEIGEGESEASRDRREDKQDAAEAAGWESQEDQDARSAWNEARAHAPRDAIVLLKLGDTYHAFDKDARQLQRALQMGDGEKAEFDSEALDRHLEQLVADGHRVAIAERTEEGGARIVGDDAKKEALRESGKKAPPRRHYNAQVREPHRADGEEGLREAFEEQIAIHWQLRAESAEQINHGISETLAQVGYKTRLQQNGLIQALRKSERDYDKIEIHGQRIFDVMGDYAKTHHPYILGAGDAEGAEQVDAEQALLERIKAGFEPELGQPSKRRAIPDDVMDDALSWLADVEQQSADNRSAEAAAIGADESSGEWWDDEWPEEREAKLTQEPWEQWGQQTPSTDDDVPYARQGDRDRYGLAEDLQEADDSHGASVAIKQGPARGAPGPKGYLRRIERGVYKFIRDPETQFAIWLTRVPTSAANIWKASPIQYSEDGRPTVHEPILARTTLRQTVAAIRQALGES